MRAVEAIVLTAARAHLRRRRRHHRIRQAADEPRAVGRDRADRRHREADDRRDPRHAARRRARGHARLPFPHRRGRHAARACRRSSSASFPAPAARSACRASSAWRRPPPMILSGRSDPGEGGAGARADRRDLRGRSGRRGHRLRAQGAGREAPAPAASARPRGQACAACAPIPASSRRSSPRMPSAHAASHAPDGRDRGAARDDSTCRSTRRSSASARRSCELRAGEQSKAQRHIFFAEREAAKIPGLSKDVEAARDQDARP